MIIDFNNDSHKNNNEYYYCISGAGAAGIALALKLGESGKRVALFEGGDRQYSQVSQDIYKGKVTEQNPYWLDLYRLRFLGGTTNHWAGRCRPFMEYDFEEKQINGLPGWPISFEEMNRFLPQAKSILELEENDTFKIVENTHIESEYFEPDVYANSSIRFRDRFSEELEQHPNIDLYLNANLVDIQLEDNLSAIKHFVIQNYNQKKQSFTAKNYIIAMGAIENARILLNCDSQIPSGIGNQTNMVGKCFMEHLNVRLGEFVSNKASWGESQSMQFMTTPKLAKEMNTGLSNISFGTVRQIKAYGRTAEIKALFNKLSCQLGVSEHLQFLYKHDCIGEGVISTLCEQFPFKDSKLALINDRDSFGLRRVELDWHLSESDINSIRNMSIAIAEEFAENNLGHVKLSSFITDSSQKIEISGHAHQMGTTRMSASKEFGVVDVNCKVHETENLYVAGSSVFSTGGAVNPTMPLLQLTYRLAEHLTSIS